VRIFLSYRRDDTSGHAGRLYDALSVRLGGGQVFQDVAAIEPGVDFGDAIVRALDNCDAVLAVIGPAWMTASTPSGLRRLEQSDDYVRLELATALAHDARVIPVLVGGAELPASADLPEDLRTLVDRQAVVLHDQSWRQDVDGLVSRLRGQRPAGRPHRALAIGGAVALALIVIAGIVWLRSADDGGENDASVPCPSSELTALQLLSPLVGADVPRYNGFGPIHFDVEEAGYRQLAPGSWLVVLKTVMTNNDDTAEVGHHQDRYENLDVDGHPAPLSCYEDLNPADGIVGPDEKATALVGFEVTRDPSGHLQLRLSNEPLPVPLDLTPT